MFSKKIIFFSIGIVLFYGCATKNETPINSQVSTLYPLETKSIYNNLNDDNITSIKINLTKYLNKKIGGDCSGFVVLVNKDNNNSYFNPKELVKYYDRSGRRSQAIFNLYKAEGKIFFENPKPGDLIFFDNTTKKTRKSKKLNITHLGIVDKINKDGTINFIHHLKGKNIKGVINLEYKNYNTLNGTKINSYIIRCKSPFCLVSNRFAGFGSLGDKKINSKEILTQK